MNLQAIHRQLDRCDICGKKIHRKDLVRTQARYNRPQGNNYFLYSSYDGSFWVPTWADYITDHCTLQTQAMGLGPDSEDARVKIASDNTTTQIRGSKTFLLDTSPAIIHTATATDISGFTSFVYGVYVGQYHANTDPAVLTVEIGNCNSGFDTLYSLKEVTTRSGRHVWVSANIADLSSNVTLSAAYFYVKVSATSSGDFYFWIDWMQLEKNASRPGAFISTGGATVDYTTERKMMTSVKVCNRCKEQLTTESARGRPRQEAEQPIYDEFQEV
jgi:hypothetical protein